jgi:hypothetical protein
MRAKLILFTALATGLVALRCTDSISEARSLDPRPLCFVSHDGRLIQSTLSVASESGGGERLLGVTELRPGASGARASANAAASGDGRSNKVVRVVEAVRLDAAGRLLRLEATLGGPSGEPDARVVLDPLHGRVESWTASVHLQWSVPNDLPWVWAPILRDPNSGAPIATPAVGRVVLRATGSMGPVRLIDLGALTSHAIMADQLVVSDGDSSDSTTSTTSPSSTTSTSSTSSTSSTTVVVGDDTIDVDEGLPSVLHLAALGTKLERIDPVRQGAMLAAADVRCALRSR